LNGLSTNGIVRLVLIVSFAIASLLGAGGFYLVLHQRALQRTALEAGRFLTTATAIRTYTDAQVGPALRNAPNNQFYEVTVPAFAAQTIYRTVQATYPGYTYREPALNPTNPDDRPTPEEVALINRFRADPALKELSGIRDDADGEVYYLARPIKVTEDCLNCHDTPQRAPAAMIAKYGPNNGFGWHPGETVAIQSLTLPAANELRETGEIAMTLVGGLLIVFIITYFALTLSIDSLLVRPLQLLAQAAESVSLTREARMPLPRSGATEIRALVAAIERLRTSLRKALRQASGDGANDRE
jgi:HAMP domain-containing protein